MLGIGRGFAGFKSALRGGLTLASLVLFLPVACSDDDDGKPPPGDGIPNGGSGFGGSSGTGGKGGTGTGGLGGEGGAGDLAPAVQITSPEDLGHPDDGTVLVGSEVEVLC